MLIETMEDVLGGAGRIVIADSDGGLLKMLNLNETESEAPATQGGQP